MANLEKAAELFLKLLPDHAIAKWVKGATESHKATLDRPPDFCPGMSGGRALVTFSRKRLLDVFIYTQYAHQPSEDRQRQFNECLTEVSEQRSILTYLFISELWYAGARIKCAGAPITEWFARYCKHHNLTPDVLNSLFSDNPGIGTLEKAEHKRARLFRERVEQLALEMWQQAGRPAEGPVDFYQEAHEQLKKAMEYRNSTGAQHIEQFKSRT